MSSSSVRLQKSRQYQFSLPLSIFKKRRERFLAGLNVEPSLTAPLAGNHGAPEEIIELQIEKRAVHVEQNGIEFGPVDAFYR